MAVEQTEAIFGPLKTRIDDAVAKLEEQIALGEGSDAPAKEIEQAKAVLEQAKIAEGA